MRPLSPQTERLYQTIKRRAFGSLPASREVPGSVAGWNEPSKAMLRAALRRDSVERGEDPAWVEKAIPRGYRVQRALRVPGEDEASRYEEAAARLPPGVRVLAILPIALGLRASEVCGLTRENVQRAAETGELIVLRKGGAEHTIRVSNLRPLFAELLDAPRRAPPVRLGGDGVSQGGVGRGGTTPTPRTPSRPLSGGPAPRPEGHGRPPRAPWERFEGEGGGEGSSPRSPGGPGGGSRWEIAGEILTSGAGSRSAYNRLRDLIESTGRDAGLRGLRPHLLRHAFATRMNRDGAPLFTVQAALGHKNIATTQRYVHASAGDVEKYQRPAPYLPR
jgi:integrase